MIRIGVIGNGSWATAMVKMLCDNPREKHLNWWIRKSDDLNYIQTYSHNPNYLSAVEIKLDRVSLFSQARDVVLNSDIVILNTPAAYLEAALGDLTAADFTGKVVISAIKGIIPSNGLVVGEYMIKEFSLKDEDVVVVGGPCHAEEVSSEKRSYLTFASTSASAATQVAALFENHYINTVVSTDMLGVEYGAVLKNIYALACGICHGLGFGDNFQAVLIANAIREMERFVYAIAPQDREINQSAYLGDLLVTAYSQFSRNRTFGAMLGKGYSVKTAQLEMNMVAEGYFAAKHIQDVLQRYQIDMPICTTVYRVLYEGAAPRRAIQDLAIYLT